MMVGRIGLAILLETKIKFLKYLISVTQSAMHKHTLSFCDKNVPGRKCYCHTVFVTKISEKKGSMV